MNKFLLVTAFIAFTVVVFSCKEKKVNPYLNNLHLKPSYLASLDTPNYTTIQWLDTLKDLGTIKKGTKVELEFRFKNTGAKPLFISEVMTNCGCTVTNIPDEPIFSGDEGKIITAFDSKEQHDSVFKTILVTSNTKPFARHYIGLKARIE